MNNGAHKEQACQAVEIIFFIALNVHQQDHDNSTNPELILQRSHIMMENALTNPHLEVARNRMICGR
jgi:hypothetical protein